MLNSIDIFSGIGGNTFALHGLFKPVLYCDISSAARKTIAKNIERGVLPQAPILQDVRLLSKDSVSGPIKVDAIIGSFPCQGLSPMGLRKGFDNAETGLFHEIVRLVDEFDPVLVFMENVPNVLNKEINIIAQLLGERDYELRWCVFGAHALGAPQVRNRWFCLCTKIGSDIDFGHIGPRKPYEWVNPPRRTVPPLEDMYRSTRCALLGNGVVPDVVRMAFFYMLSGFKTWATAFEGGPSQLLDLDSELIDSDFVLQVDVDKWPRCGLYREEKIFSFKTPPFERPNINVRLLSDIPTVVSKKVRSPLVSERSLKTWSTPRKGMTMSCRVLTERSARDLPTQLIYAEDTPEEDRKYQMSAEWVEWLMGYPTGYTKFNTP